jgi:predicted exporter
VLRLLPAQGRAIPAFRTFLERFGSLDDLYVVFSAPDGYTVGDYEDDIAAWVTMLAAVPEITRVDQGRIDDTHDWGWLADHELLLLDDANLREALRRLTPDGMRMALAQSREFLAVPSPEVTAIVQDDPLGFHDLLRRQLASTQSRLPLVMSKDGYVTSDEKRRLVIARPAKPPYDTAFSHALFGRLQAIARDRATTARTEPDDDRPLLDVQFAGGHRIALEAEAVVKRESIINGAGSLALILPLLLVVFRSLRLVAIGALPSALSFLVVLGALGYAGATLSAAAAGASAMLFGLGVDGVVLLYVTHRLKLKETHNAAAAIRGISGAAASMVLGMWTTAATFLGLLVVDFPSLEQLGLLIGASMFVCAIATLILVPASLPARATVQPPRSFTLPRFAAGVRSHARMVLAGAALLTIILGYGAIKLRVNPTLDRLRSVTEGARFLKEVTDAFALPSDVIVILQNGADLERLLDANASFVDAARRVVPGLVLQAPAALLPSVRTQQARAATVLAAMPALDKLRTDIERAATEAGFNPHAFGPFIERLGRMAATEPLTREGFSAHRLDDIISRLIASDGESSTLATYAFPKTLEERMALRQVVEAKGDAMVMTGMALVNDELSARFFPEFLKGLGLGTAVVFALILATFRNWRSVLLALTPTAIGLVWAAGILGFAHVELDLFAVFAVMTFVGIGVDYGIHLIHRYHELEDPVRATAELAPVILVAGAITLLGYGTLVGSSYPPLRSIGMVSVVSVVTLVLATVLVLPAMLRGQDS